MQASTATILHIIIRVLHLLHTAYTNVTHKVLAEVASKGYSPILLYIKGVKNLSEICLCLQSEWFIQGLPSWGHTLE